MMFDSPRPVEPAAPISLSVYCPAPMIGESPARPGIFQARPLVVVIERDLALLVDRVHVDRAGRPDRERLLGVGHIDPVVVLAAVGPPPEPELARFRGQQVFFLEAVGEREALRPRPDQQNVIGVLEHQPRHLARRLDPLERGDGAGAPGRPVHARRVELDHALLIGQPAVADRIVGRIQLLDLHAFDPGVQRIGPLGHQLDRAGDSADPVGGAHGREAGRAGTQDERGREPRLGGCRRGSAGGQRGGGTQEMTAGQGLGHEHSGGRLGWQPEGIEAARDGSVNLRLATSPAAATYRAAESLPVSGPTGSG